MYIFSPFVGCAFAGGGIYGESEGVFEIQQDMQYAIISHDNGIQKMMVTVNLDWEVSNKTAWIFPVPSEPESIKIGIAGWTPKFRGRDMIKGAKDDLKKTSEYFFAPYLLSVVVPYPLSLLYFLEPRYKISSTYVGVEVYTQIEKYGIVAEVISANLGTDIYQHLKNNGMDISEGMINQLDQYVEEDFSFIVTWVTNHNLTEVISGLLIEFPTEKAFYPLVLTSIYGDEIIPINLIIKGHATLDIYDEINDYCHIRYWDFGSWNYGENFTISPETDNFTREMFRNWDRKFTSIEIEAPSSAFTHDLWIEEGGPDNLEYVYTINDIFGRRDRLQTLILIYFFFSLIISFNLGIIILGREMEDIPFFLFMGLGNMMGIMGLFIFNSLINKVTNRYEKYTQSRVALFIASFIITFFISMWVLFTLLTAPLS
jgi:hypothetical protein